MLCDLCVYDFWKNRIWILVYLVNTFINGQLVKELFLFLQSIYDIKIILKKLLCLLFL